MTRRILITTGNGMFGHHLVAELSNREDIQVRVMVRDVAKFTLTAANLEVVTADMDEPASLSEITKDISHVFLTSPMDEHIAARERAVVDAAAANGSPMILKLFGAVRHQGDALDQQHQDSIQHIKDSGLPWALISPNSVMETSLDSLVDQLPLGVIMGMSGTGKVGMVALRDVARATAVVATTDGHEGKNYELTGPTAFDMAEAAAAYSKVLDRKIEYIDLPEAEFAKMLLDYAGYTDPVALETNVLCHLRAWKRGSAELVTHTVAELTGQEPMTLGEWIAANQDTFRHDRKLVERLEGFLLKGKYRKNVLTE